MEIKDEKFITELKNCQILLKVIDTDNLNFYDHMNVIKCETILDVLLGLLEKH